MNQRRINRWDSMLGWLAHQEQNKWTNVKSASQKLSTLEHPENERSPLWHAMFWTSPLIRLGHAEFDPATKMIVASPPGLLRIASASRAVLYGYWDSRQRRSLRKAGVRRFVHNPRRGPTCEAICAETERITEIAKKLNVWLADDSSIALLERLPTFSTLLANLKRSELSAEGYWERFDYISDLRCRWRTSQHPFEEPGLYQRKDGRTAFVFVAADYKHYQLETLDEQLAAKWDQAPKLDWHLDVENRRLLIPYGMPELPTLVSRGLTMRSARLPVTINYSGCRWTCYKSIDIRQAEKAARIMEQQFTTRSLISV